MRAVRVIGVLVAVVQLGTVLALGLSIYTIYGIASSTASGEAMGVEMTYDEATGAGVFRLRALPMNKGFLGADLSIGIGALDEGGNYIARNSTTVRLEAGHWEQVSLSLNIPADLLRDVMQGESEECFEVVLDIRTLFDLVGVSNTMRIQGGEQR